MAFRVDPYKAVTPAAKPVGVERFQTDQKFTTIDPEITTLRRSNSVPVGNSAPVDPRTITQAHNEREDLTVESIAATLTNLAMQKLIEGLNAKGVVLIDVRALNQYYQEISRGALAAAKQQLTVSST